MPPSRYVESGIAAVYDLTNWSGAVKQYLRDIDQLNKADAKQEKSGQRAGAAQDRYARTMKFAADVAKAATAQFKGAGNAVERTGQQSERAAGGISRFTERLIQIDAGTRILNSVADAVQRVAQGVQDMAGRALRIEGIGRAFNSVIAPIGNAEEILSQWREQAQNAVSDLDLMRMGNVALINTTRETRDVIGSSFGTVVRAAFAGAAATGQDFNFILEKMTRGLRRRSNALLDDIGIWVEADVANQRYAESHGLVVSQMTEAQRAAAWQAEAIRQMTAILQQAGDAGITYVQRASAEWENAIDRLAAATQEGTSQMDYGLGRAFSGVATFVDRSIPYLSAFVSEAGAAFAGVGDSAYTALASLNPEDFFAGGANIIAALAHGILSGLTMVVQAANIIAQSIANLLMGFSPPKEGPLSLIDVGGRNVVEAWLQGFEEVSTAPVEELASSVNGILAGVGNLDTKDQVTVLEQLQKRVQGRLEKSVAALMRGEGESAEVRALDAERQALAEQLELLRERAALEQVGVKLDKEAEAAQREALRLAEKEFEVTERASGGGTGRTERDRLAELQQKLDVNARLQEQYRSLGMDTNDLLREEANLNRQIAEEMTSRGLGLDATAQGLSRAAEIDELLERDRQRGGGAGGAVGLPFEDEGVGPLPTAAGGRAGGPDMSMVPAEVRAQFAGRGPEGFRGRLQGIFSGIEGDYQTFITEIGNLRDTLGSIDLFAGIQAFLDELGEDPGQALRNLANGIGEIVAAIPEGLQTIIDGIADEIERVTGISISEGFRQAGGLLAGIGIAGGIAAPVIGAVAAAITGLILAAAPIALPLIALGLLFDFINEKFGSFENALHEAGNTLRGMGAIISVAWDDVRAAVEQKWAEFQLWWAERLNELDTTLESIGIDIIPDVNVDEARAQVEAYRARGEIQAAVATAITTGGPLQLSPEIIAGVRSGAITVPERTRLLVQSAIEDALRTGDQGTLRVAATAALQLGITLPGDLAAQVEQQIGVNLSAPVAAGVTIRLTERGYETPDGQVHGTLESAVNALGAASNPFGVLIAQDGHAAITLTEQGYVVDGIVYDDIQTAIQASVPSEIPVTLTVRQTVNLVGESVIETLANTAYGVVASTNVDFGANWGGNTTRASGTGGFGALPAGGGQQLMSGRDAVQSVGPLIDILRARYVSDVAQPFQEQFTNWTEQVSTDAASAQTALSTFFDTSLVGLEGLEAELLIAQTDLALVDTATLKLAASVATWYGEAGKARSTLGELATFLETPYSKAVEVAKNITEALATALERVVEAQQASGYGPAGGIPYGGERALGGDVREGVAYRVGENGPEWFVAPADGTIIPHGNLAPPPVNVMPAPVVVQGGSSSSTTNWYVQTQQFDGASVRRYHEMQARRL